LNSNPNPYTNPNSNHSTPIFVVYNLPMIIILLDIHHLYINHIHQLKNLNTLKIHYFKNHPLSVLLIQYAVVSFCCFSLLLASKSFLNLSICVQNLKSLLHPAYLKESLDPFIVILSQPNSIYFQTHHLPTSISFKEDQSLIFLLTVIYVFLIHAMILVPSTHIHWGCRERKLIKSLQT